MQEFFNEHRTIIMVIAVIIGVILAIYYGAKHGDEDTPT